MLKFGERNFFRFITYSVMVVGMIGCGGGGTSVTNGSDDQHIQNPEPFDAPQIDASTKNAYLKAINDARAQQQDCGEEGIKAPVPPLKWNDALYKAAYEHDYDMSETDMNPLSHNGSGTQNDWTAQVKNLEYSTFKDRIENNGYGAWSALGENIAAGDAVKTAKNAVDAWLKSPGHCANLMNPNFTQVGMAHINKDGTHYINYWTQDFGKPQ